MDRQTDETVSRWLDEAAAAMGGDAARRTDVLLELEATIQERVEERTRSGQLPDEAVQDVLDALGDPAEVGSNFVPVRPLVGAHQTRPFLVRLLILFAVHYLLVIGASIAGLDLAVPPVRIAPIEDPRSLVHLFLRAAETLVFDAGLLLCVYALLPRLGRLLRFPRLALAVRPDARRSVETAVFLGLVLIVVDFLRESLLALYLPAGEGTLQIPLAGPAIADNLVLLNVWLGLAIVREVAYARAGERRATLLLDVASNAVGLYCLLRLAATEPLVDLAAAREALGPAADGLAAVLNAVLTLLALSAAALLGARIVRRLFRLKLLPG